MSNAFDYENIFDEWPGPVLLVDAAGYIKRINGLGKKFFSSSDGALRKRTINEIVPRKRHQTWIWLREMYLRDPDSAGISGGVEVSCFDGDSRPFKALVSFENTSISGQDCTWVLMIPQSDRILADGA